MPRNEFDSEHNSLQFHCDSTSVIRLLFFTIERPLNTAFAPARPYPPKLFPFEDEPLARP